MRKSTLFISAALTTFMLAVMFGVASAYQKIVQVAGSTEAVIQQSQPAEVIAATATNIAGGTFTAEQAASLASNVIGRTDLYTAEIAPLNGVDTYLVTFSSGDIVYVSMNGQILSISKLPVTVIVAPAASGGNNGGGNTSVNPPPSGGGNDNGGNDNGDDDDHDDDDDDDDDHGGDDEGHDD